MASGGSLIRYCRGLKPRQRSAHVIGRFSQFDAGFRLDKLQERSQDLFQLASQHQELSHANTPNQRICDDFRHGAGGICHAPGYT
ncbi:MAG: hypothetical protein AB7P99_19760 [Vicinamibacterales bacterium]